MRHARGLRAIWLLVPVIGCSSGPPTVEDETAAIDAAADRSLLPKNNSGSDVSSAARSSDAGATNTAAPIKSMSMPASAAAAPASGPAATPAGAMPSSANGMSAAPAATAPALCIMLSGCCALQLEASEQQLCQAIVDDQREALCKVAAVDYCATPSAASTPAGTVTRASPSDPCLELSTCCATLEEEDQEDCQGVVDAAEPAACTDSSAELCPTPVTTPAATGLACTDLLTCCATLEDDEDIADCETVAKAGDAVECGTSLDELCGAAAGGND